MNKDSDKVNDHPAGSRSRAGDLLRNNAALSRVSSFLVAGVMIFQTSRWTVLVPSYKKMFDDLGAQVGTFTRIVVGFPVWGYWLLTGVVCLTLICKDRVYEEPLTRFMINIITVILLGFVYAAIGSALTSPLTNLMQVID